MEIYPYAYFTYEPGDFVILNSGDIVCIKSHDAEGKEYVVTDATSEGKPYDVDGVAYDYKFVDTGKNERKICGKTIYMPVHQEVVIH